MKKVVSKKITGTKYRRKHDCFRLTKLIDSLVAIRDLPENKIEFVYIQLNETQICNDPQRLERGNIVSFAREVELEIKPGTFDYTKENVLILKANIDRPQESYKKK